MMRLAAIIAVLLLAGCGQKGPLYLPDDVAATPTPAASDNGNESDGNEDDEG